ncbi:diguanylate cyclase (GGDEF) domain-containing protein [Arsukibacterium tuosuense]|uniref:Diguanylate cyclase (GGDEF) domain-containing protein n=2 Tax=Arsukibacterium tuosuense TaxID=1323745 RepID=A0A285IEA2_9GAMM|nr:diguanylate cyclase (GGDEF) domain-containing protein [Arsukibacterium tuosuense]
MAKHSKYLLKESSLIQMLDPLAADWNKSQRSAPDNAASNLAAEIDFSRLNSLFDHFLDAMGIAIALVGLDGKILASSKWQRACIQFHRVNKTSRQRCHESDIDLASQLQQGSNYALYKCGNGLTDCSTPLIVDDVHLANLFIGQFFLTEPDLAFFTSQGQELGFSEQEYLSAIAEVPIVAEEKLPALLNLLTSLAQQIAELSMANKRYAHTVNTVEQQIAERTQELELQNLILSQISQGAGLTDILTCMVRQIELLHPGMRCSVLLLDPTGQHLRHGAAPSLPDFYNEAVDNLAIGIGQGSCGTAAYTGEPVIVEDINSHPYWQPFLELTQAANLAACWSQPIKNAEGKVLGTFGIYHSEPCQPTASQRQQITRYSNLAELAIDRSVSAEKIRRLAFYDDLTGLPNRRLLEERLHHAIVNSKRSKNYCAMMFIDLDNFKPVNDLYGHKTGDQVLCQVGERIGQVVREADTVARFGGDEFIVVLHEIASNKANCRQRAEQVAIKIAATISEPLMIDKEKKLSHCCNSSIGLVLFSGEQTAADLLLRQADAAMYQAKSRGKNQFCWYQP